MMKHDQTQLILDVLSSKWTIQVIQTLNDGTRRFSEIQKVLPDTKSPPNQLDMVKFHSKYDMMRESKSTIVL